MGKEKAAAVDDLLVVFKLLQRENVLVEIFLKLFICIVDVELLKAVNLRGTN